MHNLKVLTYNIHKGFSFSNRKSVLKKIRDAIHKEDPDIVFLQEIMGEFVTDKHEVEDISQCDYIGRELCKYYAYGKNVANKKGHYGNAILSKYPIEETAYMDMSTNILEKRSMLHCLIRLPEVEQPLHAFCIHLNLTEAARKKQIKQLSEYITNTIPLYEPVILAGDFNDWQKSITKILEKDGAFQEAHVAHWGAHAKTFPNKNPMLSLDRIYFRGLQLEDAIAPNQGYWRDLSDHNPLMAVFGVE